MPFDTTCRICGALFPDVPIIGETPERKIQRRAPELIAHLEKQHAQLLIEILGISAHAQAVLAMYAFEFSDNDILAIVEQRKETVMKYLRGPSQSPKTD